LAVDLVETTAVQLEYEMVATWAVAKAAWTAAMRGVVMAVLTVGQKAGERADCLVVGWAAC